MAGPGAYWIGEEERREVLDVLDGNHLYRYGDLDDPNFKRKVLTFEKEFAAYSGARYCQATSSGTSSILISLNAMGVKPGDEIIIPTYTFIASYGATIFLGAAPVLCEIDESLTMDPEDLERRITPKTKAIMPVHILGNPCNMDAIMDVANRHGIMVVEDCCQACGAAYRGKKVGTFGVTGCISFQEWKSLVSGEGGAILGNDEELMRRCAAFVNNGRDPKEEKRGYPYPGSNHRMTEFQAAVLTEQFERFKKQDEARQKNGKYLEEKLSEIPGIKPRKRYCENTRITYVMFELDYDKQYFNNVPASKFAEAVRAEGIPISGRKRKYSGGCHKEEMLEGHLNSAAFRASFSKARLDKYKESLSLPVMDNQKPSEKEMLSIDSKIAFLEKKKDMDGIVEAFAKVTKNIDKIT